MQKIIRISTQKHNELVDITEEVAKSKVGSRLPGTIERVSTEPWIYTNKETGEQRTLNYRYLYNPEEKSQVAEEVAA